MSTSVVICHNLVSFNHRLLNSSHFQPSRFSLRGRKRFNGFTVNSKKRNRKGHSKNRKWWQRFFFNDDGNWLGLGDDDMVVEDEGRSSSDGESGELSDREKFEEWKKRAEAIVELREAQEDMKNEEGRSWEDWLVEDGTKSWDFGGGSGQGGLDDVISDSTDIIPEKGFVESVRDMVLGREEDDMLYEDRVFQYASLNSAKFLAVLVIFPWLLDFVVHDYVLMPFLDSYPGRYVKTVPLAAEMLDVRRHQKLEMVKELKTEKARFRLEEEIGKSPPLSDDEVSLELRHKALELREEWRLENRSEFANIWSDMVFGISLFFLLYFNQSQVTLLKFTGYKIVNTISDTGKAFLIILITDIFLGYHSESGWQTLLEIVVEHYGFVVDDSSITLFVCLIPVILDACVKLWMFKFLPRISPMVSNIFQEMKRH